MRPPSPARSHHIRHRMAAALAAIALSTAALALPAAASGAPAATPSSATARTVVIVLAPFLTWSDVTAPYGRDLLGLAARGAIADMNCVTADQGWPNPAGGSLTFSASRWAAAPPELSATATDLPAFTAANASSLNVPDLGALGAVLHSAGRSTAAVGNADEDTSTAAGIRRPAELVASDREGRIDTRLTDESLLTPDPTAPYGVRADPDRMASAVTSALAGHPALLVVDPGDLERAHSAPGRADDQYAADHARGVLSAGTIAARISRSLGPDDVLMVLAPATDKPYYQPPFLAPTIVVGRGFAGGLTSGSTHRTGLVTNLDVAPSALSMLGLEATSTMLGLPITATGSGRSAGAARMSDTRSRIDALARLGSTVGAVDFVRDLVFIRAFCWTVLAIALAAAALALLPALRRLRAVAGYAVLFALSLPAGAWLMFAVDRYPVTPQRVGIALGVATIVVFAGAAAAIARRVRVEIVLLALTGLTSALICLDQWLGHPLETGLFSYSIRAGWRYYGMGNEAAAILVGSSLAAVGLACELGKGSRYERLLLLWLAPVIGLVAIATTAAPLAGANAGAAIWGVVAFGIAWARINRVRLTWRTAAAIVGAVVVAVAGLAILDVTRGAGETHIGRFFAGIANGDFSATRDLVVRKALNNYNYMRETPYTWLAVGLAFALAATEWLGTRPLARALAARPAIGAAVLGVIVGGAVALVTEDSGSVMPALMLFAGGLPALYLALLEPSPEDSAK